MWLIHKITILDLKIATILNSEITHIRNWEFKDFF